MQSKKNKKINKKPNYCIIVSFISFYNHCIHSIASYIYSTPFSSSRFLSAQPTSSWNRIGDVVEEFKTLGAVTGRFMTVGWWRTAGISPAGVPSEAQHSFIQNWSQPSQHPQDTQQAIAAPITSSTMTTGDEGVVNAAIQQVSVQGIFVVKLILNI